MVATVVAAVGAITAAAAATLAAITAAAAETVVTVVALRRCGAVLRAPLST